MVSTLTCTEEFVLQNLSHVNILQILIGQNWLCFANLKRSTGLMSNLRKRFSSYTLIFPFENKLK